MPKFLNTYPYTSQGIAVCDRCNTKYPIVDLRPDGDTPSLRVCKPCWDHFDPWRLPARQLEKIALTWPRPDVPLTVTSGFLITENGEAMLTENGFNLVP